MNIKKLLIEKERVAYIEHKPELAEFFDLCLQHIIRLEEEINRRDRTVAVADPEQLPLDFHGANT
jgi:hypothetical protein